MGSRLRAPAHALITALVVVHAAPARADEDGARARFDEGMTAFKEKDYEQAIARFEESYREAARPETLYAMAQAERLSGDCPTAVALYHRFLETGPAERHAEAARAGLKKCEAALSSRPLRVEPEPAAPAEPVPTERTGEVRRGDAVPAPTEPDRAPRRRFWRDPVGGVLLAAGVGSLAFGAWAFDASREAAAAGKDAETYEAYGRSLDRAERRRTWAWIGVGGGAALVAAAAVRYATVDLGPATATVTVEPSAVAVAVAGRF